MSEEEKDGNQVSESSTESSGDTSSEGIGEAPTIIVVDSALDPVVADANQEINATVAEATGDDALSQALEQAVGESHGIEHLFDPELDTREGDEPSLWEERFEAQINTFFDEAIARVPGFVDRHLRSFRRVMARNISPRTGVGDIAIGVRNMLAGVSKTVGGPDFSTTTFTHDVLTDAFEREVVSPAELESLLGRLFSEFEDEQWRRLAEASAGEDDQNVTELADSLRGKLMRHMEHEIAHDPLLAQALRSGLKIGLPATLGYVLFGKFTFAGSFGAESAGRIYKKQLNFYHRILMRLGKFEIPTWLGAVGWAGGMVGTLALGGVVEYTLNSVRDIKGAYIRQLNTARYILLYGDNPDEISGQGLLHLVRGLERQFERVRGLSGLLEAAGSEDAS